MKALLTVIALVFMQQVSAQDLTLLKKSDLSLSQAVAKISSVKAICPKLPSGFSCKAIGSQVTLKVSLNGCLDRLGGHFTSFEVIGGKGILSFGGVNIENKKSHTARCVAPPTELVRVSVPYSGEIELVNLNYNIVQ